MLARRDRYYNLLHGVLLRHRCQAVSCLGQQEVTPFSFFYKTRDTSLLRSSKGSEFGEELPACKHLASLQIVLAFRGRPVA